MHTWPLVAKLAMTRRCIAAGDRSASSQEHGRVVAAELQHGRRELAAAAAATTCRPVSPPPVKATLRTSGWADQRRAEVGAAVHDHQQAVRQAAAASSRHHSVDRSSGANGDGLTTTVLPAASAGRS